MVTFEIESSQDTERLGKLTIFFEHFTLGSARKADLVFEDSDVGDIHLIFLHNKDGLLIKSFSDLSYSSNGKKIKGGKLHRIGDTIKVGNTVLKITHLEFKNLSESFSTIYERRLKENPELEPLITQLQKELIYLENNNNV